MAGAQARNGDGVRFTPRKPRGTWSTINIRRVGELEAAGRMHRAGLEAFARRLESRSGIYSYEQSKAGLSREYEQALQANKKSRQFFQAQPPWYRRTAAHWVMSAKREETRKRRLDILIADSAAGRRIGPLSRPVSG